MNLWVLILATPFVGWLLEATLDRVLDDVTLARGLAS